MVWRQLIWFHDCKWDQFLNQICLMRAKFSANCCQKLAWPYTSRLEVLIFVCQVGNNDTKRLDAKRAYSNFFLYGVPMFIFVCDLFECWRRYIRPRRCASKSTSRCYICLQCVCYPQQQSCFNQIVSLPLFRQSERVESRRFSPASLVSYYKRLRAQIFSGFVCALCIFCRSCSIRRPSLQEIASFRSQNLQRLIHSTRA